MTAARMPEFPQDAARTSYEYLSVQKAREQRDRDQQTIRELARALKAVNVAVTCHDSQGGNLGQQIDRANPLTMETVRTALARLDSQQD